MKKILTFILIGIITLTGFSACGKGAKKTMKEKVKLWAVDSNQKIMLNQEPTLSSSTELDIVMVKNESESAQLIITPEENVVYDLKVSDLKCGDNIISSSDIELFREHYVYVNKSYNPELVTGYYPDALVPFENAKAKNENKIRKGQNQAIYVKVTTKEDTVSGTYTGKVSVIINDEILDVKLNVRVANVDIPTAVSSKTAYNILEEGNFLHGYFDESKDYYTTYYDALLDYKVNGIFIPGTQNQDASVVEWVNAIEKYAFNEKVATYCLPYKTVAVYDEEHQTQHNFFDEEKMEELLIELISRSTNEKNLLEKAYLYLVFCDEPAPEQAWRIKKTDLAFYKLREKLYNVGSLYPSDGSKDQVRESLMKVYHVVTVADHDIYYPLDENDNYVGGAEVFCPLFSDVHTNSQQNNYNFRKEKGLPTWFYGCCAPTTPYPTYHIDDRGVTARVISWMQKYYGFEGELYWAVNLTKTFKADIWKYLSIDPWYDVYTGWNDPGEGILLYPGYKYGLDKPIGSLRMELINDSKDDYELLNILENELKKASEAYKVDFNLQEYIKSMMDTLFYGMIVTDENNNFFNVRNEIINLIEVLQSPSQVVVNTTTSTTGAQTKVEVYAKNDIAVKINGKLAQKIEEDGYFRFVSNYFMVSGANSINISYTEGDKSVSFNKFIGTSSKLFASFNTQEEINKTGKTDGAKEFQGIVGEPINDTKIELNTDKAFAKNSNSLKFSYRGVANNKAYKPGIKLLGNGSSYADYSNLANVSFDVYNPEERSIKMYLGISTKAKTSNKNTAVVTTDIVEIKQGWNKVVLKADGKSSLDMSKVAEINVMIDNPIVETVNEDGEITVTELSFFSCKCFINVNFYHFLLTCKKYKDKI